MARYCVAGRAAESRRVEEACQSFCIGSLLLVTCSTAHVCTGVYSPGPTPSSWSPRNQGYSAPRRAHVGEVAAQYCVPRCSTSSSSTHPLHGRQDRAREVNSLALPECAVAPQSQSASYHRGNRGRQGSTPVRKGKPQVSTNTIAHTIIAPSHAHATNTQRGPRPCWLSIRQRTVDASSISR